ncbi:DUF3899 domain-containing protein [Neobacillus sp.]|uniref:DUF3899 domain-containing protein n=1 Tax=Neobacillus sp. TaxID=2675273 RepID=UPI0037C5A4A5
MALSAIASLMLDQGSWTKFIYYLFFISLLFLMLGGSLIVLKGGMFNGIIYSFTIFYRKISKVEEYVSQQTGNLQGPPVKKTSHFSITYSLLISGGIMFLFTLIASI